MPSVHESVVFVTGAGRGVGRALVLGFAERGAHLAAQDLTPINLDETIELARAVGARGVELVGDMAKKMQVQSLIETARETLGEIDILINQASVAPSVELLDMDEWDWDRTMGVNLKGYFLALQSIGRLMAARRQGVIVNLMVPPTRFEEGQRHPAYEVSMAGIRELTVQAARPLSASGVRIFGVEIIRDRNQALYPTSDQAGDRSEADDALSSWWQREPEKVADGVINLITGSELIKDGQIVVLDESGVVG